MNARTIIDRLLSERVYFQAHGISAVALPEGHIRVVRRTAREAEAWNMKPDDAEKWLTPYMGRINRSLASSYHGSEAFEPYTDDAKFIFKLTP